MRPIFCLFSVCTFMLFSCSLNNLKPGPEFKKAAEDVVNKYEGKLDYTYGFSASTSKGKSQYIDLNISESNILNSLDDEFRSIAAAGIAYTFYKPLEKNIKYSEINVTITKDNKEYAYEIEVQSLKKFDSLLHKFEDALQLYEAGKFEELAKGIFRDEKPEQQQTLVTRLKEKREEYGALTQAPSLFGFSVINNDGNKILAVCYSMYGQKKRHGLQLLLEPDNPQSRVVGLQFLEPNN